VRRLPKIKYRPWRCYWTPVGIVMRTQSELQEVTEQEIGGGRHVSSGPAPQTKDTGKATRTRPPRPSIARLGARAPPPTLPGLAGAGRVTRDEPRASLPCGPLTCGAWWLLVPRVGGRVRGGGRCGGEAGAHCAGGHGFFWAASFVFRSVS
jgi:hypothetical protein